MSGGIPLRDSRRREMVIGNVNKRLLLLEVKEIYLVFMMWNSINRGKIINE